MLEQMKAAAELRAKKAEEKAKIETARLEAEEKAKIETARLKAEMAKKNEVEISSANQETASNTPVINIDLTGTKAEQLILIQKQKLELEKMEKKLTEELTPEEKRQLDESQELLKKEYIDKIIAQKYSFQVLESDNSDISKKKGNIIGVFCDSSKNELTLKIKNGSDVIAKKWTANENEVSLFVNVMQEAMSGVYITKDEDKRGLLVIASANDALDIGELKDISVKKEDIPVPQKATAPKPVTKTETPIDKMNVAELTQKWKNAYKNTEVTQKNTNAKYASHRLNKMNSFIEVSEKNVSLIFASLNQSKEDIEKLLKEVVDQNLIKENLSKLWSYKRSISDEMPVLMKEARDANFGGARLKNLKECADDKSADQIIETFGRDEDGKIAHTFKQIKAVLGYIEGVNVLYKISQEVTPEQRAGLVEKLFEQKEAAEAVTKDKKAQKAGADVPPPAAKAAVKELTMAEKVAAKKAAKAAEETKVSAVLQVDAAANVSPPAAPANRDLTMAEKVAAKKAAKALEINKTDNVITSVTSAVSQSLPNNNSNQHVRG